MAAVEVHNLWLEKAGIRIDNTFDVYIYLVDAKVTESDVTSGAAEDGKSIRADGKL